MLGDAVFELSGKVVYLSNRKNNYQWKQTRSSGTSNALLESHNKCYCSILALFCHHPDGSFIYWKKRIGFDSCVQLKRQESLCHESNPGSLLPKASTLPERNQQCHNQAILALFFKAQRVEVYRSSNWIHFLAGGGSFTRSTKLTLLNVYWPFSRLFELLTLVNSQDLLPYLPT